MKLSVFVVTKDRAELLAECLKSISIAIAKASPIDAEVIVADNGSTDATLQTIENWARDCTFPVRLIQEARQGRARALNLAIGAAQGGIFAFTDDDCRLHENYIIDLLRHDAADSCEVLRGGRIELGDPRDLPVTIKTTDVREQWSRAQKSARRQNLPGVIAGCNMAMRRSLFERLGPFDEAFGPGSRVGSGDDSDYIFRAYTGGAVIEYVPDMIVFHHHGRRTLEATHAVMRRYAIGHGGLWAKHTLIDPFLCRIVYTNLKSAIREVFTRKSELDAVGFSYREAVPCHLLGVWRYLFGRGILAAKPARPKDDSLQPISLPVSSR